MANIINFGPATVTHDGASLGKTSGGSSLVIETVERQLVQRDYDKQEIVVGGTGTVQFHKWAGALTIGQSLLLRDYGIVIFTAATIKITLHKCKILLAKEIEIGTPTFKPFEARLVFTANTSGYVIKIEEGD